VTLKPSHFVYFISFVQSYFMQSALRSLLVSFVLAALRSFDFIAAQKDTETRQASRPLCRRVPATWTYVRLYPASI